jgi:YD repeat-containing protein
VFSTHPRETIRYDYERTLYPGDHLADPRIEHELTLEVDAFGNVLKAASVRYGRRRPDGGLGTADRATQSTTQVTYTEADVTNAVPDTARDADCTVVGNDHRAPVVCETRVYQLTGYPATDPAGRFRSEDFVRSEPSGSVELVHRFDSEIPYEQAPTGGRQRRLVDRARRLLRRNDLTGLLGLGLLESLALPGETYQLAYTPGLLSTVYQRPHPGEASENLLPDPGTVLDGQGADQGGYVDVNGDGHWWIPSGRVFHSSAEGDSFPDELAYARAHFFLALRYRDPFGHTVTVRYDDHDLLVRQTRDAIGNVVTAGERSLDGSIDTTKPGNDYRILQPLLVMDPNRNRTRVTFDALGMVVGTAVMGKPEEQQGDTLAGFEPDLPLAVVLNHLETPIGNPHAILGRASTRLVYDLFAYHRTKDRPAPQPPVRYTLTRETHDADSGGQHSRMQHAFVYSDGLGREIQSKMQAAPGPVPSRDADGVIIVGTDGLPEMTPGDVTPRWIGTGWTVFNNKGKPVRQYEPFFSDTHRFEFGVRVGVSPVLFYDPIERVIVTLHPNHTYEKVVFDPWRQITYDVNDTVAPRGAETGDPRTDPDTRGRVAGYFATQPATWQTWRAQRLGTELGVEEQAAATKATVHADTPTTAYFDPLGRPFLTVALNRFTRAGAVVEEAYQSRAELDIDGNERSVRDAVQQNGDPLGRIVMRYDYDLLGNRIHQASMEAGRRWTLDDVAGKTIRAWDSRDHSFRTEYDPARRPVRIFVRGIDPGLPVQEVLTERLVYGEQHPGGVRENLRGCLYLHLDQVGVVSNEAHDFKGNLLRSSRRISSDYKKTRSWTSVDAALPAGATALFDPGALEAALVPLLDADTFTNETTYDALNRVMTVTTPDSSVIRPAYNEAKLLERIDGNLHGELTSGQPVWTPFVTDIDYDAKGQRTQIVYGSGATAGRTGVATTYAYERLTLRLTRLTTRRDAGAFPGDCPRPPRSGWPGCEVQDLRYTYDPAGNITHITG